MVPQQVSFVERSSLSQRVPYREVPLYFLCQLSGYIQTERKTSLEQMREKMLQRYITRVLWCSLVMTLFETCDSFTEGEALLHNTHTETKLIVYSNRQYHRFKPSQWGSHVLIKP